MALSVGVTCGVVTQLLLDQHPALNMLEFLAPYQKEICDAMRKLVEFEEIVTMERVL